MAITRNTPPSDPKKTVPGNSRPPYRFTETPGAAPQQPQKSQEPNVKSIYHLQYGEMHDAVKAIASDLYGSENSYYQTRTVQLKAFNHFMRFGDEGLRGNTEFRRALKTVVLTPDQIKAMAIQGIDVRSVKAEFSEVVDTLGGWLVPEDVRTDMIERLPEATVIRPLADVTTTSSDVMTRIKVTGGSNRYPNGVRVTWVGDRPAKDEVDTGATFGVVQTPIHIVKATVPVPLALLEDTTYPLVDKINTWVSDAYALDEDDQFLIGLGAATPLGLLPGQTNFNGFTEAKDGGVTFGPDTLIDLTHAVARQYRKNCVFIMNDSTAKAARKFKDKNDNYIWETSYKAGEPDVCLGYPVLIHNGMPDVGVNSYFALFGDMKGYQIADRIGMSVTRDDLTESEEDVVKFLFRRRLGGQPSSEWLFSVAKHSA